MNHIDKTLESFDKNFCNIVDNKKWWTERMSTPEKVRAFLKSSLEAQEKRLKLDEAETTLKIINYGKKFLIDDLTNIMSAYLAKEIISMQEEKK